MTYEPVALDKQGRLELSAEERRRIGVKPGDWVEFLVAENRIVLRKAEALADPVADNRSAAASWETPGI